MSLVPFRFCFVSLRVVGTGHPPLSVRADRRAADHGQPEHGRHAQTRVPGDHLACFKREVSFFSSTYGVWGSFFFVVLSLSGSTGSHSCLVDTRQYVTKVVRSSLRVPTAIESCALDTEDKQSWLLRYGCLCFSVLHVPIQPQCLLIGESDQS